MVDAEARARGGAYNTYLLVPILLFFGLLIVAVLRSPSLVTSSGVGSAEIVVAPLVLSAASRVPGISPNLSVPAVMTLGYGGFLLGPVLIGLVANATSLGAAFGLIAVMLTALSFAGRAVA